MIDMDLNVKQNLRSVYTFWDFLGEVGGLYGILLVFGNFLVYIFNTISGSSLNMFLHAKLFALERKEKYRPQ